ncbi:succinyldiaminopimelate aminotransferase [Frondihabitans sp. PhB188]|uniref:succinyldiaminopimelate transaminase n=1 Tax=Frondihabitans sp. PhB188 TaxID=2485200 RepID=UPI000FC03583|nr:succinyldiaminopimelate transaminase [Frondihabitans sp. PhB188]ROQ38450.1 succinyldiaminopimelate aminotransferase [Frondihabitans sp. PhB188]
MPLNAVPLKLVPLTLPDFPWDSLADATATARAHADGIVDLSVGSPVDPTPALVRDALREATDAHSYPQVAGTPALRAAIIEWYERRRGVSGLGDANVLPTIGSKELIAGMALWLGLGPGDTVVYPRNAYPTYELGAALVGASALASDDPAEWPESTRLVWLNSPGNPDGRVLSIDRMRAAVTRARELGAVIAGDECYAELGWTPEFETDATPCILDPRVIGDSRRNVISVYSLSKQSNLAGYRAGFIAGCGEIVGRLLGVRKHAGLMPPAPVQQAMIAALADEEHVRAQKQLYRGRRDRLSAALVAAGFRIDHSEAGLYLWATRDEDAWATVAWLAERGILVAPGTFYGTDGARHVRVALTTTDERIDAAVERLSA